MATKTYPKIPAKNWWRLRQRFVQSLPSSISSNYLATLLGITERGAKNILPNLRAVGLIDDEGNTTDRAKHWRDDKDYPKVCEDIRKEVYPEELLHVAPDPVNHFDDAVSWFMRDTGSGAGNAKQMAGLYQLLTKADPTEAQDVKPSKKDAKRPSAKPSSQKTKPNPASAGGNGAAKPAKPPLAQPAPPSNQSGKLLPSVHIDIQIHIDANAKADQIDQIFASMAKHLYNK